MKTILITVSKDVIRRNILDTNFWSTLVEQNSNSRIVFVVEKGRKEYFRENFSGSNVEVVEYGKEPASF